MPELKKKLKSLTSVFPPSLEGRIGDVALFGAVGPGERGKKYVAYLIEGSAKDTLIEEQRLILNAFGLSGRNIEMPHFTVFSTISLPTSHGALGHYRAITPPGEIGVGLGPPRIVPLNPGRPPKTKE
jgi:hypothetical protein